MNFYSTGPNGLKRDTTQQNLYNLFAQTVVYEDQQLDRRKFEYVVEKEDEMRLDRISQKIYGTTGYVEELMVLNGIKNPWKIQEGDIIYFIRQDDMLAMHFEEPEEDEAIDLIAAASNTKKTRRDPDRTGGPPSLKPKGKKQVDVNLQNSKIKIIDNLS